ncbi:MAG: hypothetical protein E6J29_06125 [Chloroflexi bacterium]|nr:MAG: hypothetical protein E6J29_06125 [Chloroflexota bacterium]
MKIESPSFTETDLDLYRDQLVDHERMNLVGRLERASQRLAELGPRVAEGTGEQQDWSPNEVLAHIAVLSKFYGMLTYKIGSGQMTEHVNLRDVLGEQLAKEAPRTLVEMALADHRRSLDYLRGADAAAMRREVVVDGGRVTMRAADVAREALIGHLELHVDQLEKALG